MLKYNHGYYLYYQYKICLNVVDISFSIFILQFQCYYIVFYSENKKLFYNFDLKSSITVSARHDVEKSLRPTIYSMKTGVVSRWSVLKTT